MYFGNISVLLLIVSFVTINAQAKMKRKIAKAKNKINKTNLGSIAAPGCGCQNPILDFLSCGCRGPVAEPVYSPIASIPSYPGPVIDIPNYRYADPIEINPLACLFPTLEIPNYGIIPQPMAIPGVEVFAPVIDLPCGCSSTCGYNAPCACPSPKCSCRTPAVKLPATPYASLTAIDAPKGGCQNLQLPAYSYGISSVIELPSYGPGLVPVPACGCQGSCGCPGMPISSCECLGTCGCGGIQVSSCGCSGPCGCAGAISSCDCMGPCSCAAPPISSCGCTGPCECLGSPVSSCGCAGACDCLGITVSTCGCNGPCSCPGTIPSCGCSGPCNCPAVQSCGCSGPCGCSGIQSPYRCQLPAIEVPSIGCGCGLPGCGCGPKYLRQVTLQPPFL